MNKEFVDLGRTLKTTEKLSGDYRLG
jgi:hypothetical protein